MKLQKEELIPGRWYFAVIYNMNYFIQFEKIVNGKDIHTSNYYHSDEFHEFDTNWGFYEDVTILEIATELPTGEKLISKTFSYEIY